MKVYDAGTIRNVAIVGHSGCGKTQLISAMLFAAGAVNRLGRVDDGTTVTDFDDEAIARKHSLSSSLAHAEWLKTKINIIDTPGMANFLTDARSALRVVEAAVVVVDAVHGVEVQTEKLWADAAAANLPRLVVARPARSRACAAWSARSRSLHRDCAREIIPIQLPIGEEKELHGRRRPGADARPHLCRQRQRRDDRRRHPRRHGAGRRGGADGAGGDGGRGRRGADGGVLRRGHADPGAARDAACATPRRAARIFPLVCSSGYAGRSASQPLLDALVRYVPSPLDRPFAATAKDGSELAGHPVRQRARTPRSCGRPSPIPSPAASRCCGS